MIELRFTPHTRTVVSRRHRLLKLEPQVRVHPQPGAPIGASQCSAHWADLHWAWRAPPAAPAVVLAAAMAQKLRTFSTTSAAAAMTVTSVVSTPRSRQCHSQSRNRSRSRSRSRSRAQHLQMHPARRAIHCGGIPSQHMSVRSLVSIRRCCSGCIAAVPGHRCVDLQSLGHESHLTDAAVAPLPANRLLLTLPVRRRLGTANAAQEHARR